MAIIDAARKAGYPTEASFLRDAGLNRALYLKRTRSGHTPAELSALFGQIAKVGNNLNQLARASNRNEAIDRAKLIGALEALEGTLAAIRAAMTPG